MANIKSFPNNQDEYIGAEHVMRWHHGRSSGVFGADGNAAVSPVLDTMAVAVSDGIGWLSNDNANGVVWWVDSEAQSGAKLQLPVDMADAVLPRIDRVVVSWATTNYVDLPEVIVLKGTPASNPVAPELTNDNMVRQISLAAIRIPAGATAIDASMITDERLDSSVCGIVTEKVGVDTTVMHAQFESFFKNVVADAEEYTEQHKAAWDAFFSAVQDDTLVPVPVVTDAGKVMVVNDTGDGYILGDAQMDIPVTSETPDDSDIWIDPDGDTVEGLHLSDKNNPHGVTAAQVGAAEIEELWVNASPGSAFAAQTIALNLAGYGFVAIEFRTTPSSSSRSVRIVRNGTAGLLSEIVNVSSTGSYMTAILRIATVSSTGVKFAAGFTKGMTDANAEENTSRVIPTRIYGIKGVKE